MKLFVKVFLCLLIPFYLFGVDYDADVNGIKSKFSQVIELYSQGKNQEARELTQSAYFSHFENLEAGIRINLGQKKAYAMEKQFGEIRKAIKSKQPIQNIESMISNLNNEIDEILPMIKSGHKLEAQKSDDGGLAAAGISTDGSANPWLGVVDEINAKLDEVISAYDNKDSDALKVALNQVKFDLYRNTKLEIAIRQYDSQKMDQMIQQIIGNVLSSNLDLSKDHFNQAIKDVKDLIFTAVSNLPTDSYAMAPATNDSTEPSIDFNAVIASIKQKMSDVLKMYENNQINEAISAASDIYFDDYEASGMENRVGAIDVNLKTQTEASFSKILSLLKSRADKQTIINAQEKLYSQLQDSVSKIGTNVGGWSLFIYALSIILREGFEALIIIAAVIVYLIKTGNCNRLNIAYSSIGVAVVLSFVTAYSLDFVFGTQLAGQSRELLEGIVMLVAVGLLFYVGFWLLSNAGAKKWNVYIKEHVSSSITAGDSKALWWTVFLAVYREGAETVLFYQTLLFDAKGSADVGMIGFGFVVGIILLVISYIAIKAFSIKIPVKQFFIATSAIIFYMSIVFVGKGIMELVEGKLFVPSVIEGFPTITWLGLYPYYESLIPQILMILSLIFGLIFMNKQGNKS